MNNLEDILMDKRYGDITGYTQPELEYFFSERLNVTAEDVEICRDDLLARMKNYYDGFCFDGKTRLYNPFSILQCLSKSEFRNYWYESGSPSFMVNWMNEHQILEPEEYRHIIIIVNGNDFISIQEIVKLYNTALAGIPYDDFPKNRNEFWYRSMFVMLLRGAGIISYIEPHTSKGRADVVIHFNNLVVVCEDFLLSLISEEEPLKETELVP